MKYIVDRVTDNVAVCEIYDTTSMVEIDLSGIDFNVEEGDILVYENNKYYKDEEEKQRIMLEIEEQLNRLKNLQ